MLLLVELLRLCSFFLDERRLQLERRGRRNEAWDSTTSFSWCVDESTSPGEFVDSFASLHEEEVSDDVERDADTVVCSLEASEGGEVGGPEACSSVEESDPRKNEKEGEREKRREGKSVKVKRVRRDREKDPSSETCRLKLTRQD